MNCHEARRHWNLYYDSEGDADLHFQIQDHLGMCPACAEWFHQQSRLQNMLDEKLAAPAATPALWNKVLAKAGVIKPARRRRWVVLNGVAAALAAAILLLVWPGWIWPSPDLVQLTAERHQRLVAGQETASFHSDSDLAVEGYLRQRVSFPVRCPPRKDAGFAVAGAGDCKLAGEPVAFLTGQVDETPVSIFILPKESLARFRRQADGTRFQRHVGQYQLVGGVIDRNAVVVVGQIGPARLEKVLKAYGTYPDHH